MERSLVIDSSPPSPPPAAPAPTDTTDPFYTAQQSPEHIHVSTRELAAIMDVVCALATTQASLDQRVARVEVTLAQSQAMLLRIMSHLVSRQSSRQSLHNLLEIIPQQQPPWTC